MLTVNQKERWTTHQLLVHPWIQLSFHGHSAPSLDICLNHLKRYTARKKLKALAQVVIMTNRMKKFMFSNSDGAAIRQYQERKLSYDLTNENQNHHDIENIENLEIFDEVEEEKEIKKEEEKKKVGNDCNLPV